VRKNETKVLRVIPRPNEDVHGCYICNEGRFRPLAAADGTRLKQALAQGQPVDLDSTLEIAAKGLKEHAGRLLAVTSVQRPTEEIYLTKLLFEPLAGDKIVALKPEAEEPDGILRTGELGANARACAALDIPLVTLEELENLMTSDAVDALFLAEPAITLSGDFIRSNLQFLTYLGQVESETTAAADAAIPGLTWMEKEGTFINFQKRVQRFQPAVPAPDSGVVNDLITLTRLGRLLGQEDLPAEPAALFKKMAGEIKAFAGLTYADLSDKGALLPEAEGGAS
jgi:NADH dehydrogenase/NADH:ubiquinone oxidoreductase subunit G